MKKIGDRIVSGNASPDDVDTLEQVAVQIDGRTICAFGETRLAHPVLRPQIPRRTQSRLQKPTSTGKVVNSEGEDSGGHDGHLMLSCFGQTVGCIGLSCAFGNSP
ncbi:MAG: NADH-ubiquinone oxidoreductase-F iron-sulfur binding region domain-containing protein [Verrucomicrobiaceae bacterium]